MWPNVTASIPPGSAYTTTSEQDEYWVTDQWTVEDGFEIKDWAKPIKSYTDPKLTFYNYVYTKPGTYKVVFEATNETIKSSKKLKKEITLTITE
ncbi:hypothetical protein D3C86_1569350 [compost metagenome]